MILTLPFCISDYELLEKQIDFLFHLNSRKAQGHALLAASPDVPADARERIRISAALAFESFEELEVRPLIQKGAPKFVEINSLFRQVAQYVHQNYKNPWLFMEPDCTPTRPGWWKILADAYAAQPRRFMGNFMAVKDLRFVSRVGIYPAEAIQEFQPFLSTLPGESDKAAPFERRAGVVMVPRTTKTRLIQSLVITEETIDSVWPEAVLVHGDKSGLLRQKMNMPNPEWENATYGIYFGAGNGPVPSAPPMDVSSERHVIVVEQDVQAADVPQRLEDDRAVPLNVLTIPIKRKPGRPRKVATP